MFCVLSSDFHMQFFYFYYCEYECKYKQNVTEIDYASTLLQYCILWTLQRQIFFIII